MSKFPIDPQSISFEDILANLEDFTRNRPDFEQVRDFYDGEPASIVMQYLSAVSAFETYNNLIGRRESYLNYAQNRSSAIGIQSGKGYSAFRGRNEGVQIRVLPNTNITFNPLGYDDSQSSLGTNFYIPMAQCQGVFLYPLETISLTQGVETTIQLSFAFDEPGDAFVICPNEDLNLFRFEASNVSDDLLLYRRPVGGSYELLDYSELLFDLIYLKYVLTTNAFDSVDLRYLNNEATGGDKYDTGDIFEIRYLPLMTGSVDYSFPNDIEFLYGDIVPTSEDNVILHPYSPPETRDSIKVKGTLASETQRALRGREDARKLFMVIAQDNGIDVIDANGANLNVAVQFLNASEAISIPATVKVAYVKSDLSDLTTPERELLEGTPGNDYEDGKLNLPIRREYGVPPIRVEDSKKVVLKLTISYQLVPGVNNATLIQDIENILTQYTDDDGFLQYRQFKLQHELDLFKIEQEIEALAYIRVARISIDTPNWDSSTSYIRGDYVQDIANQPDIIFEALNNGTSDLFSPFIEVGGITAGAIRVDQPIQPEWEFDKVYSLGDVIIPSTVPSLVAEVVEITGDYKSSDTTLPSWVAVKNAIVQDDNVRWQMKDPREISSVLVWEARNSGEVNLPLAWNECYKFEYNLVLI